jgi:hypothetical protein
MLGELGQVWPSTWVEIWVPLLQHPEFCDDLARDLCREHVPEPKPTKPAPELSEGELSALNAEIRVYGERVANAKKARAALKRIWFKRPIDEISAIRFLEKSHPILRLSI